MNEPNESFEEAIGQILSEWSIQELLTAKGWFALEDIAAALDISTFQDQGEGGSTETIRQVASKRNWGSLYAAWLVCKHNPLPSVFPEYSKEMGSPGE